MDYSDFKTIFLSLTGKKVYLGFSGGADSTALLLLLNFWREKIRFELHTVHFEHGLRGEASLSDAEFCRQTALKIGVDFQLFKLNLDADASGIEEKARQARQRKWREIVGAGKNAVVVLAHHADDALENLFLRLLRGGNLSSLLSPKKSSKLDGVEYFRPLLDFSRLEIEDFLQKELQLFCHDETNSGLDYSRNFIRNKILVELKNRFDYGLKGLYKSRKVLEYDADFIEAAAAAVFTGIEHKKYLENDFWRKLHPALLYRVARLYWGVIPDFNLLEKFHDLLENSAHERLILELSPELAYHRRNGVWKLEKNLPAAEPLLWQWRIKPQIRFNNFLLSAEIIPELPNPLSQDLSCAYFDAAVVEESFWVTGRCQGDRISCFSGKKTSIKKLIIDRKLSFESYEDLFFIRTFGHRIIFAPYLSQTDYAPVSANTAEVLVIRCHRLSSDL